MLASGVSGWIGLVGAVPVGTPVARLEDALAAFAVGVGVTMAAAVEPSRRAGRVAPVEALKARLELPSTTTRPPALAGRRIRVVGVLGLAIWPRAAGEAAIVRALVVYVVLLVAALLVPVTLPTLARVGTPSSSRSPALRSGSGEPPCFVTAPGGADGRRADHRVVADRGPGWRLHGRAAASSWIADVVPGDLVLTSIFPRDLEEGIDETLVDLPGVHSVSLFATFDLAIDGRRADGAAVVGADLDDDGRLGAAGRGSP